MDALKPYHVHDLFNDSKIRRIFLKIRVPIALAAGVLMIAYAEGISRDERREGSGNDQGMRVEVTGDSAHLFLPKLRSVSGAVRRPPAHTTWDTIIPLSGDPQNDLFDLPAKPDQYKDCDW